MIAFLLALAVAVLVDAVLGDPVWRWHPARLMGRLCSLWERSWRELFPTRPGLAGVSTVLSVLFTVFLAAVTLFFYARALHPVVEWCCATFLLYTSIAAKDLLSHAQRVYIALIPCRDVELARERTAMMVGRDTAPLDWEGVVRAVVESVAENMADGVIAPIFAASVAVILQGLSPAMSAPLSAVSAAAIGALIYKAINTMDSMFGYKNERYRDFGRCAARLDDAVNWVPARLSGLAIVAAALLADRDSRAWEIFRRDRLEHSSPNAGNPEAAMAGALGIQLGGESFYAGRAVDKPTLGDPCREIVAGDILRAGSLMIRGTGLFLAAVAVVGMSVSIFLAN